MALNGYPERVMALKGYPERVSNGFKGLPRVTCRGKLLSLLFDVVVLLLITTGTPHSHIRACSPSAITHGMLSHMRSG